MNTDSERLDFIADNHRCYVRFEEGWADNTKGPFFPTLRCAIDADMELIGQEVGE